PLLAGQAASKVSLGEQSCHVWSVAFDELVLKQQIGSGGFGNGSPVAIKVAVLRPLHPSPAAGLAAACPDQQSASAHASTVAEFQREVTTMSRIPHHPNVLRLLAACVELPHLALVTE
ncbi:protein kinase domain-containing protein, partial [Haematococcus lacustris]